MFLTKKKVNHDPPVFSIPLALPLTDCELRAQITDAKKQESLGSLSRDNSRPFFRVYPLHRSSSEVLPSNKRHMRGLKGFVYVLISSTLRAQEGRGVGKPPREGRDHSLLVSCRLWALRFSRLSRLIRNGRGRLEGGLERTSMLRRDTSEHACTVYVTNLNPQLAFCVSSTKILVRHPVVGFLVHCMLSSKASRREGSRNQSPKSD